MGSKKTVIGVIILSVLAFAGSSADLVQNLSWFGDYQNFDEFKTELYATFPSYIQSIQLPNASTLVFLILSTFILIYASRKTGVFAFLGSHRRTKFWLIFRVVVSSPWLTYKLAREIHELEHILIRSKKQLKKCYLDDEDLLSSIKKDQVELASLEMELVTSKKLGRKARTKKRKELNKQLKEIKLSIKEKTNEIEKEHSEVIGAALDSILEKYQKIINLISSDVSVNVKIFDKNNRNILKTIKRIPSDTELADSKLRGRVISEEFVLISGKTIEELNVENSINDKSINSAYNLVCDENSLDFYYICNNLSKAKELGDFYSSSNEWQNYYDSLAVFLICDKASSTSENPKFNKSNGILIFDSKQKYVFIHPIMIQLGGYLTHRLYSFFAQEIIQISSSRHSE